MKKLMMQKRKDIAGTVLEKSQMGEILTTARRVGLKEGHKRFFHCKAVKVKCMKSGW